MPNRHPLVLAFALVIGCRAATTATTPAPTPASASGASPASTRPRDPSEPATHAPTPEVVAPEVASPAGAAAAPPCEGPSCSPAMVEFLIAPALGTSAPKLTVIIHNLDTAPLPMVEFADVGCFARAWLAIDVVDARGKAVAAKRCTTPRATGHASPIGVGSTVSFEVALAELFPACKRGVFRIDVAWDPQGIRASHGPTAGFDSAPSPVNLLEFTVAEPVETFTIQRGGTAKLSGGAQLHFAGHSHKMTEQGDESPLLVNGTFALADKAPASFYASLYPNRVATFELAPGHVFELLDWDYDVSMKLRYLRY